MPQVVILNPVNLLRDDGTRAHYGIGVHNMSEYDAAHWYVQAHSDKPPEPEVKNGTPEFVMKQAAANARRNLINAAVMQQAEEAKNKVLREALLTNAAAAAEEEARLETEEAEAVEANAKTAQTAREARAARRPKFTPPDADSGDGVVATPPETSVRDPNAPAVRPVVKPPGPVAPQAAPPIPPGTPPATPPK